ncbi:MAG: hybrid sensor histidine kinase/response regulator [Desulfobulbaceae bacterium]|nr:MAG: hybrid sensor histidine kinase/response regulator [Desulfobulbaceae bacterium]
MWKSEGTRQDVEQKKEGNKAMTMDKMQQPRRILVIDDDLDIWKAYQLVLTPEAVSSGTSADKINHLLSPVMEDDPAVAHYSLSFAVQGQEGYAMVEEALRKEEPFALAFVDVRMPPGWDGMETSKRIRALDPEIELVIVTAYSDHSIEEIVRAVGSSEKLLFLRKPFDPDEIKQLALSLTAKWHLSRLAEQQRQEISASEHRFRSLVETISDFVWEVDCEGRFSYCSPVSRKLYGYTPEELLGRIFFEVLCEPESRDQLRRIFSSCVDSASPYQAVERRFLTKEGRLVIVESSGTPMFDGQGRICGYRGIDRDITARKEYEEDKLRLEDRLRQAQKMEAIGTLAGGIAHDFNNILAPILGYAELALLRDPEGALASDLGQITKAARRAQDLVGQILAFSRRAPQENQPLLPQSIIKEALKLLRASLPASIEIREDVPVDCGAIMADPTQLHQIVMNLCNNAYQAMRESGGVLGVRLSRIEIDPQDGKVVGAELSPGRYALIEISDTGPGVAKEILPRIFEPYFTTKAKGEGTGLGLSVVHGIVKSFQGHITVYSEPDQGTSFHVYLPLVPDEAGLGCADCLKELPTGTERLLVVDDEDMITDMLRAMLSGLGYQVTIFNDPMEALTLLETDPLAFDLLLTDMTMPHLSGYELARRVLRLRPALPVVLCTGYSELIGREEAQANGVRAFMVKPVALQELAETIRRVLDSTQSN